mgnify:CR=1 FL=1
MHINIYMIFLDNLYTIVSTPEESAETVRFQIRLNADSVIFKAHFPGEPIMPGACIVQMVQELFSVWTKREVEIAKIVNLKFLSVIKPDEVLDLDVAIKIKKEEDQQVHINADIVKDETTYTKMSLLLHTL